MSALASGEGLLGALALAIPTAAVAWMLTRWVLEYLKRFAVFDHPNERSSHSAPTPRGGGIAILAVAAPLVATIFWLHIPEESHFYVVLALTVALAVVSWIDDLRGIAVVLRLAVHIVAVAVALALMPEQFLVFQGVLPLALDRVAAALAWIWFINLYNFMDGIDGIAGVETITIGLGLFALVATAGNEIGAPGTALALAALVTASSAAGFLILNWHPARVFMGDVGAIALGYLLGWFLLTLATWGYWSAALILPGYYLADATITIVRRALAGEAVWEAHAKHFYQRAVQRGLGHARVARFIAAGNVFLALIALLSAQVVGNTGQVMCLAAAAVTVGMMVLWLERAVPKDAPDPS